MSVNSQIPDYDLEEMLVVDAPEQLRALAHPLRDTLLELVLERAATVTEMAEAVDRPKSTIAYHVNLLVDAGLLRVVRTRRVRAIEERYYGRVARTLYVGVLSRPEDKQVAAAINGLAQAAAESVPANAADELRCTLSHARIRSRRCAPSGPRCRRSLARSPRFPAPATSSTASSPVCTRPTRHPPRRRARPGRLSAKLTVPPSRQGARGQSNRGRLGRADSAGHCCILGSCVGSAYMGGQPRSIAWGRSS